MYNLAFDGMDDAYHGLVSFVSAKGTRYQPRDRMCVEVRPATFELAQPEYGLYSGRSRRLNYRFMAVETLLYLAGLGGEPHARLILDANPAMAFATNPDTGHFDGAYGPQLVQSLPAIQDLLRKDPHTRQAVASIWSPDVPTRLAGSKDVPCTCLLHFMTEHDNDGEPMLSLHVYMRSNDLNWGTPYDVAAFTTVQLAMAGGLGLRAGRYYHTCGSLHYYEEHPANDQGERPPTLAPTSTENWIPNLPAAAWEDGRNIRVVIQDAETACQQLLSHRGSGRLWRDFVPTFEPCAVVGWLLRVMQFRHPKSDAKWRDEEAGE